LRRCPCCYRWFQHAGREIRNRPLNTCYVLEELNWIYSCRECYEDAVAYYNELWCDYYHSR